VCFISDSQLIDALKPSPDEVDHIFSHPLKGCHTGVLEGRDTEGLVEMGGQWWPHEQEFHVSGSVRRMECKLMKPSLSICGWA
jgi:coenzyme A diphosphatase NUDT7